MSIKVQSLINRSIKVSSPIGRKLFVNAPINRKLFVSSEMSVPIFAPTIPTKVTFDVPPDGVIANGAGVPGFESIIKGYTFGTNGEVRQVSGIGRTTSLANTDGAFFTLEDDLNLLNVDTTWEVTQKIKVTSISSGNRYMSMVRGSKTTTKIALWPTDVILIAQMLGDLRVAFFYRNTSGTLTQLALFSNAYTVGVETNMEIKKDATDYTFTLGAVSSPIARSSVQSETNNFYTVGAFATIINIHVGENDDIERK